MNFAFKLMQEVFLSLGSHGPSTTWSMFRPIFVQGVVLPWHWRVLFKSLQQWADRVVDSRVHLGSNKGYVGLLVPQTLQTLEVPFVLIAAKVQKFLIILLLCRIKLFQNAIDSGFERFQLYGCCSCCQPGIPQIPTRSSIFFQLVDYPRSSRRIRSSLPACDKGSTPGVGFCTGGPTRIMTV